MLMLMLMLMLLLVLVLLLEDSFDIRPSHRQNRIIAEESCPPLVAEAQQHEHDDEHEQDSPTSESGLKLGSSLQTCSITEPNRMPQ